MRPKSIVLLALALGCGVVASLGIMQVMANRGAEPAQSEVEDILVAICDIPMGDPLSPQMVKKEEWPKDKIPQGALRTLGDIENRRPKCRIYAGTPILDSNLLGKGMLDQGASDAIPKGMRVIAVKVDLVSGSASLIRPGDRVDVLAYLRPGGNDLNRTITKTILQDIKVFAVDNDWEAAGASGEKSVTAKTVSLLVTPAQAEKVTMATEMGTVRLIMRSPDDKEVVKVAGTGAADMLGAEAMGSDRTFASLFPLPAAGGLKPSLAAGLLGLFGSHKEKPKPPAPDPPSNPPEAKKLETFTVRILSPSQATEAVLEATSEDRPASASDNSFLYWRPSSSSPQAMPPQAIPPLGILPQAPLPPTMDRPAAKSAKASMPIVPGPAGAADAPAGTPDNKKLPEE